MTSVTVTSVTNQVVVTEGDGSTVVATVPVTSTITATTEGPQGPAGAGAYIYEQSTAATTWVINHNLGFKPSVELLDSGSQEIDGEITHTSNNQTVVTLNPASAGVARLT